MRRGPPAQRRDVGGAIQAATSGVLTDAAMPTTVSGQTGSRWVAAAAGWQDRALPFAGSRPPLSAGGRVERDGRRRPREPSSAAVSWSRTASPGRCHQRPELMVTLSMDASGWPRPDICCRSKRPNFAAEAQRRPPATARRSAVTPARPSVVAELGVADAAVVVDDEVCAVRGRERVVERCGRLGQDAQRQRRAAGGEEQDDREDRGLEPASPKIGGGLGRTAPITPPSGPPGRR